MPLAGVRLTPLPALGFGLRRGGDAGLGLVFGAGLQHEPAAGAEELGQLIHSRQSRGFDCSELLGKLKQAETEKRAALAALRKAEEDLKATIPQVMVMQEMAKPRETNVLLRGD
mgnify:CR=1 FL=1